MGSHRFKPRRTYRPRRPRQSDSWADAARGLGPILLVAPVAVFCGLYFADGPPDVEAAANRASAETDLSDWYAASEPTGAWPQPVDDGAPYAPYEPASEPGFAPAAQSGGSTPVAARFSRCGDGARVTCVVDGDTIWLDGTKIRIADINTPEAGTPGCAREAQLAERATARLTELLNQGSFAVAPNPDGRDSDKYGRKLRVLTRDGASLGQTLVREGLAEEWQGYRREWC